MRRQRIPPIVYTAAEMAWLEANRGLVISDYHRAFCEAFGRDVSAANLHGLRKRKGWKVGRAKGRTAGRRRRYSPAEIAWLGSNRTMAIADYHRGFCEAFDRSDITAAQLHALRKREGWRTGRSGHFAKGSVPPNKGKSMPFHPNSAATRFKKCHRGGVAAEKYVPIGTERVRDGYLVRKINDDMPLQRRWRAVHLIRWEALNGPLPGGMCLKCLDGDTANTDPSNWELIPRGVLARLNGGPHKKRLAYNAASAELKPTVMAVAKLSHEIHQVRKREAA